LKNIKTITKTRKNKQRRKTNRGEKNNPEAPFEEEHDMYI